MPDVREVEAAMSRVRAEAPRVVEGMSRHPLPDLFPLLRVAATLPPIVAPHIVLIINVVGKQQCICIP